MKLWLRLFLVLVLLIPAQAVFADAASDKMSILYNSVFYDPDDTAVPSPTTGATGAPGSVSTAPSNPTGNIALGKTLAAARGFTGSEFDCLYTLWMGESGWRTDAANPTSSAYGIPQSLPGSKMASVAPDWMTNPSTQITWGLNYIASRYKTPCIALSMWQARSPHWY